MKLRTSSLAYKQKFLDYLPFRDKSPAPSSLYINAIPPPTLLTPNTIYEIELHFSNPLTKLKSLLDFDHYLLLGHFNKERTSPDFPIAKR